MGARTVSLAYWSISLLVCFLLVIFQASADVYLHNPRGSNNRNCERNVNRNNANRLFDSQNNAAGGYACPRAVGGPETQTPRMYYYGGSQLSIEWTNQHGCGNGKTNCDIILQYACEDTMPGLRDGTPINNADAATTTIPSNENSADDERFGMHENFEYYAKCFTRERNKGLFTADQQFALPHAVRTRQDNNGQRFGFECPEERDYYPYWHPTPWKDIAIIASNPKKCKFYQKESQNVKNKGECIHTNGPGPGKFPRIFDWYNNEQSCTTPDPQRLDPDRANGQEWKMHGKHNIDAPDCIDGEKYWSRVNHLGNGKDGYPLMFNWTIPNLDQDSCVLRIRYNITPGEIDDDLDASKNSIIQQDPVVFLQRGNPTPKSKKFLSLAVNTDQWGRTFQDRSYVFSIKKRPKDVSSKATIYNLNVRGKRGNIVQVYPSVEYDFVPNVLDIKEDDYVHIQWVGSDYNPQRGCNDGEGGPPDKLIPNPAINPRADRSNIVETALLDYHHPYDFDGLRKKTMFVKSNGDPDLDLIDKLAFLDQDESKCWTAEEMLAEPNKNVREYSVENCGKLNGAETPYFDAGLIRMRKPGKFTYMSTRNNNFSNRNQKGIVNIRSKKDKRDTELIEESQASAPVSAQLGAIEHPEHVIDSSAHLQLRNSKQDDQNEEADFSANDVDSNTQAKDNDNSGDGNKQGCETRNVAQEAPATLTSGDSGSQVSGSGSGSGESGHSNLTLILSIIGAAFGGVALGAIIMLVLQRTQSKKKRAFSMELQDELMGEGNFNPL